MDMRTRVKMGARVRSSHTSWESYRISDQYCMQGEEKCLVSRPKSVVE